MVPARLDMMPSLLGRESALGLPQHFRKTFQAPANADAAIEQGFGAPDSAIRMEDKNPASAAGRRCAYRLDAVLIRRGRTRTL